MHCLALMIFWEAQVICLVLDSQRQAHVDLVRVILGDAQFLLFVGSLCFLCMIINRLSD